MRDLRKEVYYLKCKDFTLLLEVAEDVDAQPSSEIHSITTGNILRDDVTVDES